MGVGVARRGGVSVFVRLCDKVWNLRCGGGRRRLAMGVLFCPVAADDGGCFGNAW